MSSPNQLSFLPDDYLETKAQNRTNAICAGLFAVVVAAIGGAFYLTERQVKSVETDYSEVVRRYTDAARPIEQFRRMQEQQRRMETQAALSASLLEKVPRSYLLAEITNALPGSVSLIELGMESRLRNGPAPRQVYKTIFEEKKAEIEAAKLAATAGQQPKVFDVYLKITGVADNDQQVAALLTKLATSKLLSDVNLVVSDEFQQAAKDEKLRKFVIEMMLNPEAEVKPQGQKLNKVVEVEASAKERS
jgi:Tfp pilus assembly protein PilN